MRVVYTSFSLAGTLSACEILMFRKFRICRVGYIKAVSSWQAQDRFSFNFGQNLYTSNFRSIARRRTETFSMVLDASWSFC